MTEHDERAQEPERELEAMEERSDRLEDDIADAEEDWQRKKRDSSVPGAPEPDDSDDEAGRTSAG
jgi:hypothetical protein